MKVVNSHSHLNGQEYLLVHDSQTYADVMAVVSSVHGDALAKVADLRKRWRICANWLHNSLKKGGWEDIRGSRRFWLKRGRVALGMSVTAVPPIPFETFAEHLLLYTGDIINVGIEILPVKAMASDTKGGRSLSTGIAYYEGEVYNVMRHGRNSPPVPLLIIGIAP